VYTSWNNKGEIHRAVYRKLLRGDCTLVTASLRSRKNPILIYRFPRLISVFVSLHARWIHQIVHLWTISNAMLQLGVLLVSWRARYDPFLAIKSTRVRTDNRLDDSSGRLNKALFPSHVPLANTTKSRGISVMWDFIARVQLRGNPAARIRGRPRVHLRTLNVRMACLQKWRKTRGSDVAVNLHAGCTRSTRSVPIDAGWFTRERFRDECDRVRRGD